MSNNKKANSGTVAKIIAIILAIILGLGVILSLGYHLGWFSKDEDPDETVEEVFSTDNVEVSNGEANGLSLKISKLSADQAEHKYSLLASQYVSGSSYEISVTYNDDATNPSFTWTKSSDAVSLTPSADTYSCAVVCSAAFSEQVTVTVTADDNANATASCLVDYVKRLSGTSGLAIALNNGSVTVTDNGSKTYTLGTTYTTAPTYSATASTYGTGSMTEDYTVAYSFYSNVTSSTFSAGSTVSAFLENATGYAPDSADNLYQIYTLCNAKSNDVVVTVTFTGAITGQVYTYTYTLELDCSNVYIPVNSIEIDYDHLYF